ncbi:MAG: hypothetical protein J6328_02275 [Bacilli bacterium]|nr:hypothetical protein [Bacilli bacterium]
MDIKKPVFEFCEGDDCCDEEEGEEIEFAKLSEFQNSQVLSKRADSNLQ